MRVRATPAPDREADPERFRPVAAASPAPVDPAPVHFLLPRQAVLAQVLFLLQAAVLASPALARDPVPFLLARVRALLPTELPAK